MAHNEIAPLKGEVAQLRQFNVDNASSNADSACVEHDISDIKIMLEKLSSQGKLEQSQEEAFYAETVRNRPSLDNMARTENNERQNELSQEAEIGMMVTSAKPSNTVSDSKE